VSFGRTVTESALKTMRTRATDESRELVYYGYTGAGQAGQPTESSKRKGSEREPFKMRHAAEAVTCRALIRWLRRETLRAASWHGRCPSARPG
jgi:hypothetical protein